MQKMSYSAEMRGSMVTCSLSCGITAGLVPRYAHAFTWFCQHGCKLDAFGINSDLKPVSDRPQVVAHLDRVRIPLYTRAVGEGDEEEAREYSFDMNANGRSDLICRPKLALDALNSRLEADMAGDIVGDAATAAAADEEDDGHDDNQELHGKDGRGRKNSKPLKINSELSANMVLAVKYRLAQKRSMREVALILRAQLAQIGLVKGMRVRRAALTHFTYGS